MSDASITHTISAFFDEKAHADLAIDKLVDAGITRSAITLTAGQGAHQAVEPPAPRGIWDMLESLFFPEHDRHVYAEGLRRGGLLVTVSGLTLDQKEVAGDVLDADGSVDMDDRSKRWQDDGWAPSHAGLVPDFTNRTYAKSDGSLVGGNAQAAFHNGQHDRGAADETSTGMVAYRAFEFGTRDRDTGRVRVRSYTIGRSSKPQDSPQPQVSNEL